MKRFPGLILVFFLYQYVSAQTIDIKKLNALLNLSKDKLETHLQKKGFKRAGYITGMNAGFMKTKKERSGSITRCFQIDPTHDGYDLIYKTTSQQEFRELEKELRFGFYHAPEANAGSVLYQKNDLVINCSSEQVDSSLYYVIRANKKEIPKLKDIVFAEDLLQLDSHEYLSKAFGRQNVKKDVFYFTPTEGKKCSIIFPNTSRQAIFIWSDEQHLRNISFVIIGEQLNSDKDANTVMLSKWRSVQGIYCGMSLREVENLNQESVSFYNWRTETAGFLAPKNKGALDFSRIKPVFNCMNCNFLYVDKGVDIIQSSYALDANQKVYVASFAVLPQKKTGDVSQLK